MDIYPSHDSAAETEKPSCSMIDILVVQDEYSAHFFYELFLNSCRTSFEYHCLLRHVTGRASVAET